MVLFQTNSVSNATGETNIASVVEMDLEYVVLLILKKLSIISLIWILFIIRFVHPVLWPERDWIRLVDGAIVFSQLPVSQLEYMKI